MKKIIAIFALALIGLVGCSSAANEESSTPASSNSESPVSQAASRPSNVSYAAMIPDAEALFGVDSNITDPDGGTAYIFNIPEATIEQFQEYVAAVKEDGYFTDARYDTTASFGAYNEEGTYWVQVDFDEDREILYVICQEARNS